MQPNLPKNPPATGQTPTRTGHPKRAAAVKQLFEGQRLITDTAEKLKADFDSATNKGQRGFLARSIADLYRSWAQLEDRRQVLKGIARPTPETAQERRNRRKNAARTVIPAVFTETAEDVAKTA